VGDFRVVNAIDDDSRQVLITMIRDRKDVPVALPPLGPGATSLEAGHCGGAISNLGS
jgi:hypothetical protein